jgi:hypothetical protein
VLVFITSVLGLSWAGMWQLFVASRKAPLVGLGSPLTVLTSCQRFPDSSFKLVLCRVFRYYTAECIRCPSFGRVHTARCGIFGGLERHDLPQQVQCHPSYPFLSSGRHSVQ